MDCKEYFNESNVVTMNELESEYNRFWQTAILYSRHEYFDIMFEMPSCDIKSKK